MENSTTTPMVNGHTNDVLCPTSDQSTKPPHRFSTPTNNNNTSLGEQRVHSYMATRNGGGDPVTALGVRGLAPEASVSRRTSQVLQDLANALTIIRRQG
ncbi:hypothetical protein CIB48_g10629 [Xylaria polymorpha]|nr:hypothetical protein CIB48_g10629 [Xylaria polymorpha]